MHRKKFLIIAASIGSGHMKAADAIAEALKNKYPDSVITIIDFTEWGISMATAFMKTAYLAILRIVPNLYEFLYKFTGGKAGGLSVQSLISLVTNRDIGKLVKKYRPDALICTHPFPAGACSWYVKRNPRSFLFSTLITDYSVHQMWIYPNVDSYFVAREAMKEDLVAAGLPFERIYVTGIPISERFLHETPQEYIRKRYSLSAKLPTVLIMGGGLGLGEVEAALNKLEEVEQPLQILVIAGKNEQLKKRIEKGKKSLRHKVTVWGYCSEVPDLMSLSTLLISKPGALTITEAMASGLPMILHDPIPGPETDNAVFAARHGAAVWVRSTDGLALAIKDLLQDSEKLKQMKEQAKKSCRPYAAADIVKYITQQRFSPHL